MASNLHLQQSVQKLTQWERRVLEHFLERRPVARNPNEVFSAQLTAGQRVADSVAAFGGSWPFIGLFFLFFVIWMAVNGESRRPFDPFPFILLNLILSCLAAIQAPVIMMSQNRQAAKDRLNAQQDYELNLKTEMEVMALHAKLDEIRNWQATALKELAQDRQALLEKLEALTDPAKDSPAPREHD